MKNINKKKLMTFSMLGLFALALVSAVVHYQTINVDITVDEALSALPVVISVTGAYPGETITEDITITNTADVSLYTTLTWTEVTNVAGVTYTTNQALDGVQTIAPNGDTILTISFTIEEDSEIGTFDGTVVLDRVAEPVA